MADEPDDPRTDEHTAEANAADPKDRQLDAFRARPGESPLSTQQGVLIDDTDNSLRAGERGPTLLEDFQLREKLTHFDHERIPERVVHARGSGAYGYFELTESLEEYTCADFLCRVGVRTPVFVRFSTVQGPRGSADTVRDVRGFATKFYTRHGNYDLVGNNMPVFFIQDAIKFPDFVHAVKPEPHREIPTGASAHDTFWDFCSLQPESTHMLMWLMSDRAIPRSFRMMQGFGVHTFRLVNAEGIGTFVKFHWRPVLGVASLVWDEAQLTAGRDPDFNRRDLWDAIEAGHYPQFELGVQLVSEAEESAFDFDLLDPTKLIPEERVPVRTVGRMVLNRNPDDFFAETEQAAFHTANVVPGIDFSNDPLLQGRNFSYLDTQLIRLGGPNFSQLPVNRPVAPVSNNQRDGYGQHRVHSGRAGYAPNSYGATQVAQPGTERVYQHYQRRVDGETIRRRSPSFADHYSQATLFWNSMSDWEKRHIVEAFAFELAHVESMQVRERMVKNLTHVDPRLADQVAAKIGVRAQRADAGSQTQHGDQERGDQERGEEAAAQGAEQHAEGRPRSDSPAAHRSPALSQQNLLSDRLDGRKVALLRAQGANQSRGLELREQLAARGVSTVLLVPDRPGEVSADGKYNDDPMPRPPAHDSSTFYDAVVLLGETGSWLAEDRDARRFVHEAYRHGKPIGLLDGRQETGLAALAAVVAKDEDGLREDGGVITQDDPEGSTSAFTQRLLGALEKHRFPQREVS